MKRYRFLTLRGYVSLLIGRYGIQAVEKRISTIIRAYFEVVK